MADRHRQHNYSKWSKEELVRAESIAGKFLEDNSKEIARSFRVKAECLELLASRLAPVGTPIDQRLDCLAQISEIAAVIQEESEGFFELASQPMVARLLSTVRKK
ncbi:MAG: hypothetical protein FJW37_15385 [Acidobacteria bacterium]|nr:hypothetical protein [Acidobacteriota bacterium]